MPVEVKPLDNYQLWVRFSDGIEGIVGLSEFAGSGVFALWDDYREFRKVHIGPDGEIAWSDQIDMCPDAIYLKITGKRPEELFPKLRENGLLDLWERAANHQPLYRVEPLE